MLAAGHGRWGGARCGPPAGRPRGEPGGSAPAGSVDQAWGGAVGGCRAHRGGAGAAVQRVSCRAGKLRGGKAAAMDAGPRQSHLGGLRHLPQRGSLSAALILETAAALPSRSRSSRGSWLRRRSSASPAFHPASTCASKSILSAAQQGEGGAARVWGARQLPEAALRGGPCCCWGPARQAHPVTLALGPPHGEAGEAGVGQGGGRTPGPGQAPLRAAHPCRLGARAGGQGRADWGPGRQRTGNGR